MARLQSFSIVHWVSLASLLLLLPSCGGSSGGDDVATRGTDSNDDAGGPADDVGAEVDDDGADSEDDDATPDDDGEAADDDAPDDSADDEPANDDAVGDDAPSPSDPATITDGPLDLPETDIEALTPPEPLLPDTPPETPVTELPDEEFEALCDPYLDEATTTLSNLSALCGLAGVNAANDSNAATEEEYQRACGEARIQCETDSAAAQVLTESLECTVPDNCTATVEEVEACYQSLYLLNAAVLEPLGLTEFPACEELTPTEGGVIAAQVLLYLLANAAIAGEATDMPVEEGADPCGDLEMTCPGLAAPNVTPTMP